MSRCPAHALHNAVSMTSSGKKEGDESKLIYYNNIMSININSVTNIRSSTLPELNATVQHSSSDKLAILGEGARAHCTSST